LGRAGEFPEGKSCHDKVSDANWFWQLFTKKEACRWEAAIR
jgi:hypothetical protein